MDFFFLIYLLLGMTSQNLWLSCFFPYKVNFTTCKSVKKKRRVHKKKKKIKNEFSLDNNRFISLCRDIYCAYVGFTNCKSNKMANIFQIKIFGNDEPSGTNLLLFVTRNFSFIFIGSNSWNEKIFWNRFVFCCCIFFFLSI